MHAGIADDPRRARSHLLGSAITRDSRPGMCRRKCFREGLRKADRDAVRTSRCDPRYAFIRLSTMLPQRAARAGYDALLAGAVANYESLDEEARAVVVQLEEAPEVSYLDW